MVQSLEELHVLIEKLEEEEEEEDVKKRVRGGDEKGRELEEISQAPRSLTSLKFLALPYRSLLALLSVVSTLCDKLRGLSSRATSARALLKTLARSMTGDALTQSSLSRDNVIEEAQLLGIIPFGSGGSVGEEGRGSMIPPIIVEVLKKRMSLVGELEDSILRCCAELESELSPLVSFNSGGVHSLKLTPCPVSLLQGILNTIATTREQVTALTTSHHFQSPQTPSSSFLLSFLSTLGDELAVECSRASDEVTGIFAPLTQQQHQSPLSNEIELWERSLESVVTAAMVCIQNVVPKGDALQSPSPSSLSLWGFASSLRTSTSEEHDENRKNHSTLDAPSPVPVGESGVEKEDEPDGPLPTDIPAVSSQAFHTLSILCNSLSSIPMTLLYSRSCRLFCRGGSNSVNPSNDAVNHPTTLRHLHLQTLRSALTLLSSTASTLAVITADSLHLHRSTVKLALVSASSLHKLLKEGFCGVGDKDGEGDGDGEGEGDAGGKGSSDGAGGGAFQTGTGMGEGVGMQDVSQEMESEGQVLGLQGEEGRNEGEEKKEGEGKKEKKEKGVEMSEDFDGLEGDLEDEDQDEGEQGGDEEEGEELDREMGKADGKDAAIVDEKLWDKPESEEGEGEDQKEKSEHATKGKNSAGGLRSAEGEGMEAEEEGGEQEESGEPNENCGVDEKVKYEEVDGEDGAPMEEEKREEGGAKDLKPKENLEVDSDEEKLRDEKGGVVPERNETVEKRGEGEKENEEVEREEENDEGGEMEGEEGGEGSPQTQPPSPPPQATDVDFVIPSSLSIDEGGEEEGESDGSNRAPEIPEEMQEASKDMEEGEEENESPPDSTEQHHDNHPPIPKSTDDATKGSAATESQGLGSTGGQDGMQSSADCFGDDPPPSMDQQSGKRDDCIEEEVEPVGDTEKEFGQSGLEDFQNSLGEGSRQESQSAGASSWRIDSMKREENGRRDKCPPQSLPPKAKNRNPLTLDPEKALRQWQARFRNSNGDGSEEDHADGAAQEEPPSSMNPSTKNLDVIAGSGLDKAELDYLAPKESSGEEQEEREKTEKDEEDKSVIPSSTAALLDEEGGMGEENTDAIDKKSKGKGEGEEKGEDEVIVCHTSHSLVQPAAQRATKERNGMNNEEVEEEEENEDSGMVEENAAINVQDANQALLENLSNSGTENIGGASNEITNSLFINAASLVMDSSAAPEQSSMNSSWLDNEDGGPAATAWSSASESAWRNLCSLTSEHASRLCENLRLILEPTKASKLGGEYKSGKRINMRRVIPYIASNFRKDKIWQRRSRPSSRTYQVLLAVDDSSSMSPANRGGGKVALQALAVIARALSRLEVGEVGVISFGSTVKTLHPLGSSFTDEAGASVLSSFTFSQDGTRVDALLDCIVGTMEKGRATSVGGGAGSAGASHKFFQLAFIISDGILGGGVERERIRQWAIEAQRAGVLLVCVIVDKGGAECDSITQTQSIQFVNGAVVKTAYLDQYPLPLYLIIKDLHSLPDVLADAVRQFFEIMAGAN